MSGRRGSGAVRLTVCTKGGQDEDEGREVWYVLDLHKAFEDGLRLHRRAEVWYVLFVDIADCTADDQVVDPSERSAESMSLIENGPAFDSTHNHPQRLV